MKPTLNERELLALRIELARAKLHLNAAQLSRTAHLASISPAALFASGFDGRQAWQWLSLLPVNRYLKIALTAAWIWRRFLPKK